MKHIKSIFAASLFALLGLAGCAAPSSEPASTPTELPQPERVEVTLTEFAIESSIMEFEVGKSYEFVITNEGLIEHELRIIPPAGEEGPDHGDEEHSEALLIVEAADLGPGETATVKYTFDDHDAEGPLELACHIAGHYEANMRADISVK